MAATRYVRSTDGSNADNGTTWALAKADLTGVAAIDTAGDTLWVSQVHAESSASAQTWNFAGTPASPTKLYCGNDGAEPPTALASTATVTNTLVSGNGLIVNGNVYMYGLGFTVTAIMEFGSNNGDKITCDTCAFSLAGGGSGSQLLQTTQNTGGTEVFMRDCTITLANAANFINTSGKWTMQGGSALAGTATPTVTTGLFRVGVGGRGGQLLVENFDFSQFSTSLCLVHTAQSTNGTAIFRNCKMPSSWNLGTAPTLPDLRLSTYGCANAATPYQMLIQDYAGFIQHETTVVKSSGASDGTTPLSWKATTNANAGFPLQPLVTDEIVAWNDTTGSSKTATIEFIHDSLTNLKDNEIWMELLYLGTGSQVLGSRVSDVTSTLIATAADQDASSVTWTTTGLTNPNKQKCVVTFTPQVKGPVIAKVYIAKASKVVYIDPVLTIT